MKVTISELTPVLEQLIKSGKAVRITVSGNSMYPMLRDGIDSVQLSPLSRKLKRGDIPLYKRSGGKYVMHRIIKIENGAYHIAGDNQLQLEYPIYPEQIVAVVTGFYRRNKYISLNSILFRMYSSMWVVGFKHRPTLLKIFRRAARIMRSIWKKSPLQ